MFTLRFDMRAPSIGAPPTELYAAATDMSAWAVEFSGTTAVVGVSSHTMFLSRAKSGPFRFVAEAVPGAGELTAARTHVYDDGADGRLVTVATHVFRSV